MFKKLYPRMAVIYTDGCCLFNGLAGARAGIGIWWDDHHRWNISERLLGRATNNRAEIHAAARGIQQAKQKGFDGVIVISDSQFLIKSATKYMEVWQGNGYINTRRKSVINKDDFLHLTDCMDGIQVLWEWVPAHSGDYGNERADELARLGALKEK